MSGDTNAQQQAGGYNPNSMDSKITEILTELRGLGRSLDEHRSETRAGFTGVTTEVASMKEDVAELKAFRKDLKKKVAVVAGGLATGITGMVHAFLSWLNGSGGTPPPTGHH